MADQISFDWAHTHARRTDPETSHAAAERSEGLASRHHAMIMFILRDGRARAAEEIADLSAGLLDMVGVCRRLNELRRKELIEPSGELHINRSGRQALRYRIVRAA